jgi:hypothetical protein
MHWAYRVVKEQNEAVTLHVINEVYFEDDGTPGAYCSAEVVSEDGVDGIRAELNRMLEALDMPVLVIENGNIVGEEPVP